VNPPDEDPEDDPPASGVPDPEELDDPRPELDPLDEAVPLEELPAPPEELLVDPDEPAPEDDPAPLLELDAPPEDELLAPLVPLDDPAGPPPLDDEEAPASASLKLPPPVDEPLHAAMRDAPTKTTPVDRLRMVRNLLSSFENGVHACEVQRARSGSKGTSTLAYGVFPGSEPSRNSIESSRWTISTTSLR
jgi:hypothetical protein